eukprot:CAMPEP_0204342962 /NCGR_PEP_ID=MMETSP0469-20131031/24543_1 /ASSEMBLY_ACC=CAM_ASM_000384 /TAXON_ID=2969 /ORGANISM="Oxyrrhis marina" /LENGTH=47 /DNA_ID= /DNA_START= /DNA_END= /DNA_ORIENTATION=
MWRKVLGASGAGPAVGPAAWALLFVGVFSRLGCASCARISVDRDLAG